jgi:hypothetical protein
MREDQSHTMRWVLFWVFLMLFALACLGTLAMVFLGYGPSAGEERRTLVNLLIGQTATSLIALFYYLFGIKKAPQSPSVPDEPRLDQKATENLLVDLAERTAECHKLREEKGILLGEIELLRGLNERIVGVLGAGESLSMREIVGRLANVGLPAVQAALGKLIQEKVIEVDGMQPAGSYRMARVK